MCIRESCSDLWMQVQQLLEEMELEPILCNNTSERFEGLSACCSNFDIKIQGNHAYSFKEVLVSTYLLGVSYPCHNFPLFVVATLGRKSWWFL